MTVGYDVLAWAARSRTPSVSEWATMLANHLLDRIFMTRVAAPVDADRDAPRRGVVGPNGLARFEDVREDWRGALVER